MVLPIVCRVKRLRAIFPGFARFRVTLGWTMSQKIAAVSKDDITGRLIGVFKNLISEGALTPGGRLPAERDMAENFGVSRSSLRQALKVLEIMGVISQRVGDGTYLNAGAPSILSEPMEFLILLDG